MPSHFIDVINADPYSDTTDWTISTTQIPIKVGTTLSDIEKLNGKPFKVENFVLNSGVIGAPTMDWNGGNLPESLVLVFDFKTDPEEMTEVQRQTISDYFSSDSPHIKDLGLHVMGMLLHWDNPSNG